MFLKQFRNYAKKNKNLKICLLNVDIDFVEFNKLCIRKLL